MYYLYLKTHNVTGLKYLGKTIKDPYKYKGSGTGWREHLKKYGNDVTTEVLCQSNDIQEVRKAALKYQRNVDVRSSTDFANRILESVPGVNCLDDPYRKHFSGELEPKLRSICPKCNVEIRTVFHYKECQSVG